MFRPSQRYLVLTLPFLLCALAMTYKMRAQLPQSFVTAVSKNGMEEELRSDAKILADDVLSSGGIVVGPDPAPTVNPSLGTGKQPLRGPNTQVNDPSLDNTQIFAGFRPFLHFTESETTAAALGQNIVVSYNSSAGARLAPNPDTTVGGLIFTRILFSGFSVSNDGGQTWTSGFVPGTPGNELFTFGDGVVAADRRGNFYYAGLGQGFGPDGKIHGTVNLNTSTDGGRTFGTAVIVAVDDGSDKEWLAVGPDPRVPGRDNIYVTWTSFKPGPPAGPGGSTLNIGISTNGGRTFQAKEIFAPGTDPDPTKPQNFIQFSNPVVDPANGRLYLPFAHFSNSDVDFFRMLVSDDAGENFRLVNFNLPGAPDPTLVPLVQAGTLEDCGRPGGGLRLAITQGNNIGGGRFGLPRFVQSTRLAIQPSLAASNGNVFLAYNASDSPFFGDPSSSSNIFLIRSTDGGQTWVGPQQVNPSVAGEPRHVHPAIALESVGQQVDISYYTQHADGSVALDLVSTGRSSNFALGNALRITGQSFDLPPTNIPIPTLTQPFRTTNYDRNIVPCYALGEYNGLFNNFGNVYAVWGDGRNLVTEPVNALDPISGQTHAQTDNFFQRVKPIN